MSIPSESSPTRRSGEHLRAAGQGRRAEARSDDLETRLYRPLVLSALTRMGSFAWVRRILGCEVALLRGLPDRTLFPRPGPRDAASHR